jgi:hypothetical protein
MSCKCLFLGNRPQDLKLMHAENGRGRRLGSSGRRTLNLHDETGLRRVKDHGA